VDCLTDTQPCDPQRAGTKPCGISALGGGIRLRSYEAHRAAHLLPIVGSVGRVKPPYTSGRRLVPFGSAFAAKPPLKVPTSLSPPSCVEQADSTKPMQAPAIRDKENRA